MRRDAVSRLGLACLGAIVLPLASTAPAFAIAGAIDTPGVALPADYPVDAQAQVNAALRREDCRFLGGSFINSWTTLRYGGDTRALNQFLDDLVKCPQVTVHVSFKQLKDDCAWRVGHDAHSNRFQVEVNLNSQQVQLESLYLPVLAGQN